MNERKQVQDLEPGDVFLWSGLPVVLESQQAARPLKQYGQSTWLTVSLDGHHHRLNYFDREWVTIVAMEDVTVTHRTRDPEAVKAELYAFEDRYRVPSADMHKAFTNDNGDLVETADFRRWDFLYTGLGVRRQP